jgi:serine/threonine-protein kinase
MVYHCLTGRPPYEGSPAVILHRLLSASQLPPPSQLAPTVPPELDAIVLPCLQKDLADRYASAAELADALQAFLDSEGRG